MSAIHQIIHLLNDAFDDLGVSIAPATLEDVSITLYKSMSLHTRNFHTLDHIFEMAEVENPRHVVAAFFHDLVYYQVDGDFLPEVWSLIGRYIDVEPETGRVHIVDDIPSAERVVQPTLDIFGFQPGQQLSPFAGQNEFLSALTMNIRLAELLSLRDLLEMTACIEGTVAFRGEDAAGLDCFDHLKRRLRLVSDRYDLQLGEEELTTIVQSAVQFANKDVENFTAADPAYFLDNTWKLLPELNPALQTADLYSIKEFRLALQRMSNFFGALRPELVFHQHQGVPSDERYQQMITLAGQNIEIARDYLGVKILPLVILEVLAEVTGGDAPIALFMGDVPEGDELTIRLEDYLQAAEVANGQVESSTLFLLLSKGRASEVGFDIRNSPTAAFLYKNLSQEDLSALQGQVGRYMANEMTPQEFLQQAPQAALAAIIRACSNTAVTRRSQLLHLLE